jgi:hypothetical protein
MSIFPEEDHELFVIAGSIIFSRGYSLIDHYFGIAETEDVPFLNPDLFGSPGYV